MMCLYVLMVGATSCLDQVVHAFPVADTLPTSCPCVDIFHVDLRDSVEQRVRRKCLMYRVDLVQFGGQVPNPKDPYTAVGEQDWKRLGDPPRWRWSCRTRNHILFWRMLQIWLGTNIVVVEECF